jgi:ABC-type transport system involved in multi-copper enzyme maturation permease subunit
MMSEMTSVTMEQPISAPARNEHVVMGSQHFISILGRSIAGELYKIRRRKMSKVLGTIAIVTAILASIFTSTATTTAPSLQSVLVDSITVANFIGVLLLIIMSGTIVGEEYSQGSIRLLLSRGPTRVQFLLAKIGAMLVCVFIVLISLVAVGIITWTIFGLPKGHTIAVEPLTGLQLLHILLYILATILSLFTYCVLTISLSSWGKATAAGVTAVLIWWFLEGGISSVFTIVGNKFDNAFGLFLQAIPSYLIGNNLSILRMNQEYYLTSNVNSSGSNLQAGLVVLVYLIVSTGITWWTLQTRDITN